MKQLRRKIRLVLFTTLAGLSVVLTLHTLLAGTPLPAGWAPQVTPVQRDLPAITAEGTLRVALPADDIAYVEGRSRQRGLAFDLAQRVARRLGLRMVAVPVKHPAFGVREVLRGRADILAVADAGPGGSDGLAVWSGPIDSSEPVVVGRDAASIRTLDDLRDRTIAVISATALDDLAFQWRRRLGGRLNVTRLPVMISERELVAGAARGAWPLVLLDLQRARLETSLHPAVTCSRVLDRALPVRWAMRPNAPELARVVSRILEEMRVMGIVADLEREYLENPSRLRRLRAPRLAPDGSLSPWDNLFRRAAQVHGLDWRLLAALSYAESRHDPFGVGPGGSIGLMQLMPATARALGADDPFDPEQNVDAGARHLAWLHSLYPQIAAEDRLAFALAAYNMGLAHLDDARALAVTRGLDPDRWEGNVAAVLPLLEDPEIGSRLEHGMARGGFTVDYVARVLSLHRSYTGAAAPAVQKASLNSTPAP